MRGGETMLTQQKKVSIGLTQFIDFTLKGSAAKTNMVRKIKYQSEYHPAFDYWKQLRDGIVQFHEQNLDVNFFEELIKTIDMKKKLNYTNAIKQYQKFLKGKEVIWFSPGKANWTNSELNVRSTPELGLYIDGEPHLVKLYFKGKNERVDKRNTSTILTLLNTATYEKEHDDIVIRSVLNTHKNKLFSENKINEDKLISLESEATQFMFIWNKI